MNGGTDAWYIEIVMRVSRKAGPLPYTKRSGPAETIARAPTLAVLVLEGDFHLRAVRFHLAIVELQIQLGDLGNAQIAQGLAGATDGRSSSFLPRLRAGANELDDLIDALSHDRVLRVCGGARADCA